jgi:hypothetical protein
MPQQPSAPAGPGGAGRPGEYGRGEPDGVQPDGGGTPADEWPDELWPDDPVPPGGPGHAGGEPAPGRGRATLPGRPGGPGMPGSQGGRPPRRHRPVILAAVALGAAVMGGGTALAVRALGSSPRPAAAGPGSRPSVVLPGGGQQPGGTGQPGPNAGFPGGAGGAASIFLVGEVTAVTSRSITVGGPGHTLTGAVTAATRITGKVAGISGIKAGDEVSAQFTRRGGGMVAVAVQDPARPPGGVSLP